MSTSAERRVNASDSRWEIKNKDPGSCLRGSPGEWTVHHGCHPQDRPLDSAHISTVSFHQNAKSALMDLDESIKPSVTSSEMTKFKMLLCKRLSARRHSAVCITVGL